MAQDRARILQRALGDLTNARLRAAFDKDAPRIPFEKGFRCPAEDYGTIAVDHQVGLPHCSAHGLRKAGTKIAVGNKATVHQLTSIYGWETQNRPNSTRVRRPRS